MAVAGGWRKRGEESTSFLKKRSKKLYTLEPRLCSRRALRIKSFLVLFFKKERLASFSATHQAR
jgi:hypothetical protein